MKKAAETNTATTPKSTPELKKVSEGLYTVVDYVPLKPENAAEVRKIIENLLAPIRATPKE
jgi:hypothetical protein